MERDAISLVARTRTVSDESSQSCRDMLLTVIESDQGIHIVAAFTKAIPYPEKIMRILRALEDRGGAVAG